ncbi:unnamed protein product [Staurois parvus]|uniref:CRIB domain-containing protein n=1 Tax=Staurois parvus TaxID=386267 RepID=A0ABN9BQK1_9NEOB|nr:unnamed protein product [Staurois parvus]
MSLASLPVIKNLVSRSRRERVSLTPDMISLPLGDFRHTMHVGRKGEVFGDTSFLSNCHEKQRHNRWSYITKKLRQARWMSPEPQSPGHPTSPPPPVSPSLRMLCPCHFSTNGIGMMKEMGAQKKLGIVSQRQAALMV